MPRIRSIKPDFFASEDVSALPVSARLTWIGLWTHCDDHGRTKDNVRLIKAAVWPLDPDVSLAAVEDDLVALDAGGRIVRYTDTDGKRYLAVVNWHVHQSIPKASGPRHPAPPIPTNPVGLCRTCDAQTVLAQGTPAAPAEADPTATGALPESSRSSTGGKGKEGKGKEGTRASGGKPPRRCPTHLTTPNPPPCGACAEARQVHDSWPTPDVTAPPCPRHPDEPATNCQRCPSELAGKPPGWRELALAETQGRRPPALAATG